MPKISVIIPVYNVEKYLSECLDSLINQTLKDIEIICIDDKSTDSSLSILKEYASKDFRIKIIEMEENSGPGAARNIGLDVAQGEYISFVDPDDWIELNTYEELYKQAEQIDSEIVLFGYKRIYMQTDNVVMPPVFREAINSHDYIEYKVESGENIKREDAIKFLLVSPMYSWNKLFSAKFIKENSIKFPNYRCYEDVEFVAKSFINAKRVSYVDKCLYNYRTYKQSLVNMLDSSKIELHSKVYDDIKEYFKTIGMYEYFKLNLDYFLITYATMSYSKLSKQNGGKLIKNI